MKTKLRTAAITDEFCPDIEAAAQAMADIGMTGAELRVVFGKNILDLTDSEVEAAKAAVNAKGLEVVSLSSPLLKCVLPDSPPVDTRFQHDVFASQHTFEDQPRLARRAFEIAHKTGARVIRVFSYWRTVEPEKCFDRIAEALGCLARDAAKEDLIIGVENEHACNISTGADTARLLAAVDHPNLQVVWDPANAYVAGEIPFPDGYRALPANRIAHVHAKDCRILEQHKPIWGPLGTCDIDWKGQIAALLADGYSGWVSLETHWPGPQGNKLQASIICGCNLQSLLSV
ncbi:MAG TPA: sugar phosphate isomerase/epimerase family protein [Bryobacteraceae bacterium]|nr:sugar phosphate isomerase/epimerase family protein [Bryobacteraceae bacterium]HOQ46355.1 sugar phosphate isomerase/epimerase family protein [Bryobacteraceae bacterium]HPQ16115.1 sugar phosphate isomerase/epimerase family protein [Bryobacteraceae bacterium]HPU72208.1 sugar phosphate isomerase/epimerase family protein [Bryobacteraceae bacterium]